MTEEKKRHRGWKIASWLLGGLLGIAVLLPLSLYIPWVQNKVKDIACRWASEKTGMDISTPCSKPRMSRLMWRSNPC